MSNWLSSIDWDLVISLIGAIGTVGLGIIAFIQNTRLTKINRRLQERDSIAKLHTFIISSETNKKELYTSYEKNFDYSNNLFSILYLDGNVGPSDNVVINMNFRCINGIYPSQFFIRDCSVFFLDNNCKFINASDEYKPIVLQNNCDIRICFHLAISNKKDIFESHFRGKDQIFAFQVRIFFKTPFGIVTEIDYYGCFGQTVDKGGKTTNENIVESLNIVSVTYQE